MIGKWFSKSGKDVTASSNQSQSPSAPSKDAPPPGDFWGEAASESEYDASTMIMRAEPATLASPGVSTSAPRIINEFDAATFIMRPGAAAFDEATIVGRAAVNTPPAGPDLPLPAGTLLNDRYEVIKPIGRGGFSYVYLCQHLRNGRLNAVKEAYGPGSYRLGAQVLSSNPTATRQARDGLLREVSAISRINHPGVVRFEDVFEANGTLCFAMDFVEGESLSTLLARRRGVSAETFEPLAASLLDAVEILHTNDVLHGDIKPGNIIVRPDKSVVLIDFGTAARLTDMDYAEPILTPGYSAPERYVAHGEVGAWSDVYSCAATLAAALAGQPPPSHDTSASDDAGIATFMEAAGKRFSGHDTWLKGATLGLRSDVGERLARVADLRAAMGMAARAVDAPLVQPEVRSDGRSVFISYAHGDSEIVETLVRAIQRRGAGVWIDRQGIAPGSRAWGVDILNGMRGAQIVLLFSSARSMASDNVKDEVYLAKELRKPIVVARLDQAPFSDEVLMFLTRTQHISATEMEAPAFAAAIVDVLNKEKGLAA
jgi:serine/threonine protein kinase